MRIRKIIVATQHFAPDDSTTAALMTEISLALAKLADVEVLSGSAYSGKARDACGGPRVYAIPNTIAPKAALTKRLRLEFIFAIRTFFCVLARAKRDDVVFVVTTPFVLPYAAVAAAFVKRAQSVLMLHDLYPDVLIVTGIIRANGLIAKALRIANGLMFRALDAVITIGRDTERLLERYDGARKDKLRFIPNWATLRIGRRPFIGNRFRRDDAAFVVGLSGNSGFTHDPVVVFEAAKRLQNDANVHFLLSGWGTGFDILKRVQQEQNLRNVTIVERVPEEQLEELLAAADAWLIPYRPDVAGVSIPSRFYNLLAVGRPIILISEPDSEAAMTIAEHDIGWVVTPANADALAQTIIEAASAGQAVSKGERAVQVAQEFGRDAALEKYRAVFQGLLDRKTS